MTTAQLGCHVVQQIMITEELLSRGVNVPLK